MTNFKQQPKVRIKETGEVKKALYLYYKDEKLHMVRVQKTTEESDNPYKNDLGMMQCENLKADEIEFITPDHYANIGADRKYTNAKNPDFNANRVSGKELFEDTKVSDCCGAEIYSHFKPNQWCECSSCNNRCEAVEEKPRWANLTDEDREGLKECAEIFNRDTKPDPIEPVEIREYGDLKVYSDDEVAEKVNEIIERINLLSNHE